MPSYRWILTFNILAPLLESVYPTFIMQYVLLSPSGPPSLHCALFVLLFLQSQRSCQMERWNFNLESLLDINHAPLISVFSAKLFTFISQPDIRVWVANIERHSDSSRLSNLFAFLQQKSSDFIKGGAAGEYVIADLFIPPRLAYSPSADFPVW